MVISTNWLKQLQELMYDIFTQMMHICLFMNGRLVSSQVIYSLLIQDILCCVLFLLISHYKLLWHNILGLVCNALNMQKRNTTRAINDHYNCIPINTDYIFFSPIYLQKDSIPPMKKKWMLDLMDNMLEIFGNLDNNY